MIKNLLLGIDIGTTNTKMILIDNEGSILASASRPATLHSRFVGWAEEDPSEWWQNVCDLVPECLQQAGIQATQIAGIAVSGMVPTVIILDKEGQVLRNSIQQNDARVVAEVNEFRSKTDKNVILKKTGSAITQQSVGPKISWLMKHEADVMKNVAHILGSYDYINFRLTGNYYVEHNWALESGLYNLSTKMWDEELLDLYQIDPSWMCSVKESSAIIGTVTASAAAETGLARDIPVVAGSADHIASAFSAGVKNEGDLLVKLGGAGDILYCTDILGFEERLFLDFHLIPGKYLINGCMASSGSIIKWYKNNFAPDMEYRELDTAAESLPPGSDGLVLLPYFLGEKTPINNPLARGTLVGLTLSHNSNHIFRAILEGISYAFQNHLDVMAENNWYPKKVRVTNGGADSRLWKQITADVLGLPLEKVAGHPGSSLGAAFVAGMGTEIFSSWDEIEKYIQISEVIQPDFKNHAVYQDLYKISREIYDRLESVYPKLSNK
jgi:xylulokinase